MTQVEKLAARISNLDASALYEIVVYVTAEQTIGFWMVKKVTERLEGETKRDIMRADNQTANPA